MSKHTPGPWTACIEGENQTFGDCHEIQAGEHMACVAEVPFASSGTTDGQEGSTEISAEEAIANARLIAAAPDLLEALELIAEMYPSDMESSRVARAAIAKAKGEAC